MIASDVTASSASAWKLPSDHKVLRAKKPCVLEVDSGVQRSSACSGLDDDVIEPRVACCIPWNSEGPANGPSDRRRASESRREAKAVAHQVIVEMVSAGWRESEAALVLADAFEDYCLYLAERPEHSLRAANMNPIRVTS